MRLTILLLILFLASPFAQAQDSNSIQQSRFDSSIVSDSTGHLGDSLPSVIGSSLVFQFTYEDLLSKNRWIQSLKIPQRDPLRLRHPNSQDLFFYLLLGMSIFFGILKLTFPRYFSNIFRVFFNTSLRQAQLADQMLQSSWSSIFYNTLFFLSAGLLVFIFLQNYFPDTGWSPFVFYLLSVVFLSLMYLVKFVWLSFFSWVTGLRRELHRYVFIVFLTNKILGVVLLIFLPFLLFADSQISAQLQILIFAVIGFFLIIRFLKAYSLVKSQLRISLFHFLIYLVALEVLPIFLAGRLALILLEKKL